MAFQIIIWSYYMAKKTLKFSYLWMVLFMMSMPIHAERNYDSTPVTVFPSGEDERTIAGSASYIDDEELKKFGYTDSERILNRIPGVYSQTEDGFGLRTNLGMRGVSAKRSAKTNIMEDGVLQGPAQYSNASMYYYPTAGRAEGVEVIKGAAAIGTGPRTTAGTINYISRQVPTAGTDGYVNMTFGDDGYDRFHTYYGGNIGDFGYVVEYHHYGSDGFKTINTNGGDAGFDKQDNLVKVRYTPSGSSMNQYFELTSINSEESSNETYIGLTTAQFAANPYQRMAASAFDNMSTDYHRYIFTHYMEPMDNVQVTSKLYKTRYSRLWGKVGAVFVKTADGLGSGTLTDLSFSTHGFYELMHASGSGVFANNYTVNRAYNIVFGTTATDAAAGEYIERSMGHRDYTMQGFQTVINMQMGMHDLELGYRRHKDLRQRMDSGFVRKYVKDSNGLVSLMVGGDSAQGSQTGAERKHADAVSLHIKDTIKHGNFTTVLGLRHEDVEYNKGTMANAGSSIQDKTNEATMIGMSTNYDLRNGASIFAGYHQGYSPTGPSSSAQPEESDNFEVGVRYSQPGSYFEAVGFFVDYDNLLESCTISSGCSSGGSDLGASNNAGEAEVYGLELQYNLDNMFAAPAMKGQGTTASAVRFPLIMSALIQSSEYKTDTNSTPGRTGNDIMYIPKSQIFVGTGMHTANWSLDLSAKYYDSMFTNEENSQRTGKAWIFDLTGSHKLPAMIPGTRDAKVFVHVDNLFDKVFVASEHNHGKRPNKPVSVSAGVSFGF